MLLWSEGQNSPQRERWAERERLGVFVIWGNIKFRNFLCCFGVVSIMNGNNIWWVLTKALDVVLNKFTSFKDTENKGS